MDAPALGAMILSSPALLPAAAPLPSDGLLARLTQLKVQPAETLGLLKASAQPHDLALYAILSHPAAIAANNRSLTSLLGSEGFRALTETAAGLDELARRDVAVRALLSSGESAAALDEFSNRFDGYGEAPFGGESPAVVAPVVQPQKASSGLKTADWTKVQLSAKEIERSREAMHDDPAIVEYRSRFSRFQDRSYRLWHLVRGLTSVLTGSRPQSLSEAETEAIRYYGGYFFHQLNELLREAPPDSGIWERKLSAMAKLIVSGLNKLPDHEGTVSRYMWTDDADLHARYEVGSVVTEDGFTSATRRRRRLLLPTGGGNISLKLVIRSKTGKSVQHLMFRPFEKEVLFRPGTKFLVRSKELGTVVLAGPPRAEYVIHLEEL